MITKRKLHIILILLGFLLHLNMSGQSVKRFALSLQGGGNVFYGNAYPKDIMHTSFSGTMTFHTFHWAGLIAKVETGTLGGTSAYADGQILFSASSQYQLISLTGFLNLTNIVMDPFVKRQFDILAFAGTGQISSTYSFPYYNESLPQKYTLGTSNNPEVVYPLIGGFVFEYEIFKNFNLLFEFTGYIENSDRLDGVAYGSVDEERLLYFEPEAWQLMSYEEEYLLTGEHPSPKGLNYYDNFMTLEVGIKYYFGKKLQRKGYKVYKYLPKSYLKFAPKY